MKSIKENIVVLFLGIISSGLLMLNGCSKNDEAMEKQKLVKTVEVSPDHLKITFPENSPGLERIKTMKISKGRAMISVFAPARVVATISAGTSSGEKIFLFESSDITSLYSSYKQSKANVGLTTKNLERTQEMFKNLAATGRDLNQAETDVANARASMAEMESRLRTAGFNPKELENTPPGSIWLEANVLETQLSEVDRGEAVDIFFNAFPDKKFEGRAVSIGDVVDPTTRMVKVRVTMKDHLGKLLPGMFGKIDFGDPKENVLLIPMSAVFTVEGTDYVFVETAANEFTRKNIILGPQNQSNVIVLKGINGGETIVTEGALLLKGLSFSY
jgi:cobalt-zinc-cadmium efflux system membrane fusion protein